jgi:DNA-binding MarR family transcriptional regulator
MTGAPTTTTWLNDKEMRAWRGYIQTISVLEVALEADLAKDGLTTGDYQVLVYLSEREDRCMRMCDLATLLNLTPSGLTRRLDGLVKAGYVMRQQSDEDRRVNMAVLTDVGFAKLVACAPEHVMSVRRNFIDLLTPEQIDTLGDVFTALAKYHNTPFVSQG